jgi:type VI secretion system secreted protein Hcp
MKNMQRLTKYLVASATCVALAAPFEALAGSLYLKLDKINGEATLKGHEKELELESWQFGMTRPTVAGPTGMSRAGSKVCISDMTVTRALDSASPALMNGILIGLNIATAKLAFVENVDDKVVDRMTIEMTGVLISSYSVSSGGDRPYESVSFSFATANVKFFPLKNDGTPGTPTTTSINRATMGSC